MDELEDDVDEVEQSMSSQEESTDTQFKQKFERLVKQGEVENINVVILKDSIDEITDESLLNKAQNRDTRKTAKQLYADRLNEIDSVDEEDDDEEDDVGDVDIPEDNLPGDTTDESSEEDNVEENHDGEEIEQDLQEKDMSADNIEVDIGDVAPNAMTKDEAEEQERRQGIMVWGDPGMGKTHFSYTMPDPVCIIDTEGKSDDISHKFEGTGNGDPFIWQPSDYDGAVKALDEAFEVLEQFHSQAGVLGTIVVDSMSIMWDWSQQKYVEFAYPTKDDTSEVEFSSAMGRGGESDWKQIKRYHNVNFRQRIIDSPFHFCWTQMRGDDYSAVMEGETTNPPDKPVGEKENPYKANYIVHLIEDEDGAPIGNLEKSALTKHNYVGLRYPTYDKHNEILERLDAVETDRSSEDISDIEQDFGIKLIQGNPSYVEQS